MKKYLINFSFAILLFIAGSILHDVVKLRSIGKLVAYSGYLYIAVFHLVMILRSRCLEDTPIAQKPIMVWAIEHTQAAYQIPLKYIAMQTGICLLLFALGYVAHDMWRMRTLGKLLAYGSLGYFHAMLFFIIYQSTVLEGIVNIFARTFSKINTYIDPKYQFWMNRSFIIVACGVVSVLMGAFFYEVLRWRSVGSLLHYAGAIAILIGLYQSSARKRLIKGIRVLFAESEKAESTPVTSTSAPDEITPVENKKTTPQPSRLLALCVLFIVPLFAHILVFGILSNAFSPKTDPTGHMAGSFDAYVFVLLSLPMVVVLSITALTQAFNRNYTNYRKYLKTNIIIALSPFVIVLGVVIFYGIGTTMS